MDGSVYVLCMKIYFDIFSGAYALSRVNACMRSRYVGGAYAFSRLHTWMRVCILDIHEGRDRIDERTFECRVCCFAVAYVDARMLS